MAATIGKEGQPKQLRPVENPEELQPEPTSQALTAVDPSREYGESEALCGDIDVSYHLAYWHTE